ncbi:chemotaxis protein CheA [Shewanella maritima]|uniref:chemotaxis protein CheA n=1 Tax=Shewanella maritima TaxID=2520507 RepID=UPI003734FAD2
MNIDLSQFSQIFFEECLEGLAAMETELLAIDIKSFDDEAINTIFRAAHSIKGGSATFGFTQVADFTHLLETLLDEIREGERALTLEHIDMLLKSVDMLREMIDALMQEQDFANPEFAPLKQRFQQALIDSPQSASQQTTDNSEQVFEATADTDKQTWWRIDFIPGPDILRCGNDPVYMFTELSELGTLQVTLNAVPYPDFTEFDPEVCHLQWQLDLLTDSPQARLAEVFEWVEDECDIIYTQQSRDASLEASLFKQTQALTTDDVLNNQVDVTANEPTTTIDDSVNNDFDFNQAVASAFDSLATAAGNEQLATTELSNAKAESNNNFSSILSELDQLDTAEPAAPSAIEQQSSSLKTETESAPHIQQAGENNPITASTPAEVTSPQKTKTSAIAEAASSVRVSTEKIDQLINMVGELVITQAMLGQMGQQDELNKDTMIDLRLGLEQLATHTRELQESVMQIRMMPISFAFNRFPRLVHDISQQLNKQVDLNLSGEDTEIDKTVMEKIVDPLVHLVRNAMDHGIESPATRQQQGKSPQGTINLNAFHRGGNIIIEIHDDGAGINTDKVLKLAQQKGLVENNCELTQDDIHQLIFAPGFSTAEKVSDISGRGVGLDVVKRNITELNGTINIQSVPGKGSIISISLPLTLAILDGQLIRIGEHIYVVPLVAIHESLQVKPSQVNHLGNNQEVVHLREEFIPIIKAYQQFNHTPQSTKTHEGLVMIVDNNNKKVGLLVDELLSQQQVVIKSLEENYTKTPGVSGATILGDGKVALIIDVPTLAQMAGIGTNKENAA